MNGVKTFATPSRLAPMAQPCPHCGVLCLVRLAGRGTALEIVEVCGLPHLPVCSQSVYVPALHAYRRKGAVAF